MENSSNAINSNINHNICDKSISSFNKEFNNNNNVLISLGSSKGSVASGYSGNENEFINSSSCNLEDSLKSIEFNSQFKNLNLHGYSSENTDVNSKDNSFSSNFKSDSNGNSDKNKLIHIKKNESNNSINCRANNNKKSLFNKEKKEPIKEMKEDLITFLDNINFELDEYICVQKGSR
jgi:hypothetical protein